IPSAELTASTTWSGPTAICTSGGERPLDACDNASQPTPGTGEASDGTSPRPPEAPRTDGVEERTVARSWVAVPPSCAARFTIAAAGRLARATARTIATHAEDQPAFKAIPFPRSIPPAVSLRPSRAIKVPPDASG